MAHTFVERMKETRDGDFHLTWMLPSSNTAIAATAAQEGGVKFKELLHNYDPLRERIRFSC
jgi:hypothetical protein